MSLKKLLISPNKTNYDVVYFVKCNEMFDILLTTHIICGQSSGNRMKYSIK